MTRTVYFGPPGTGKTTTLLNLVEKALEDGYLASRIAFVSFTQKAANEAADRAGARFNLTRADLPMFRTLHSLAFRALGMSRGDVMGESDYEEVGRLCGITFSGRQNIEEGVWSGGATGDALQFIEQYARTRLMTLRDAYDEVAPDFPFTELQRFADELRRYKTTTGLRDYTDFIELFADNPPDLGIDVLIVDEVQDLSPLQWRMVDALAATAGDVYLAGDDDQAIYRWSGADASRMRRDPGEHVVLGQSHRLPRRIHAYADRIVKRIVSREPKTWAPRDDEGAVVAHSSIESVPLEEGQWLILVRNHYLIARLRTELETRGLPFTVYGTNTLTPSHVAAIYTWERLRAGKAQPVESVRDAYALLRVGHEVQRGFKSLGKVDDERVLTMAELRESFGLLTDAPWYEALAGIPPAKRSYYRSVMRQYGSLRHAPRIHVSTIHAAKGGEADNVLLFPDMSSRCMRAMTASPDDEHRVFYVAVTRARRTLHLMAGRGPTRYPLP